MYSVEQITWLSGHIFRNIAKNQHSLKNRASYEKNYNNSDQMLEEQFNHT